MKKKMILPVIVLFLLILLLPIPRGVYKDGGTREYTALLYKIVAWNRLTEDSTYQKTKVYFLADRFKSIHTLWEKEEKNIEHTFTATVIDVSSDTATVEPLGNKDEAKSADRIRFATAELDDFGAQPGDIVTITYKGGICETYPATLHAIAWEKTYDLRFMQYNGEWIDRTPDHISAESLFSDIIITEIYADCFFAQTAIPMPYRIKLNGTLSDAWCVGDQIYVTYENAYYDEDTYRVEADLLTVEKSDFQLDPNVCYKPVLYLYPEKTEQVCVRLALQGQLTCTYPAYQNGWTVTAQPDGTLTDENGMLYNYLYWEGVTDAQWELSTGFCIKGEDTADFLEDALAKLGLTRREANEFIVYWLPQMQENPYNIISFQTDRYTRAAELQIEPQPDTLLRVFMVWQATDTFVPICEQALIAPERKGFTAVEWGGCRLEKQEAAILR